MWSENLKRYSILFLPVGVAKGGFVSTHLNISTIVNLL